MSVIRSGMSEGVAAACVLESMSTYLTQVGVHSLEGGVADFRAPRHTIQPVLIAAVGRQGLTKGKEYFEVAIDCWPGRWPRCCGGRRGCNVAVRR